MRVISDAARLEALCAAAKGWNALMLPTVGAAGEVVKCDAQGDYLVQFELDSDKTEAPASAAAAASSGPPRLPVTFYYPPQALQLVRGGEPAMNARVRVGQSMSMRGLCCWKRPGARGGGVMMPSAQTHLYGCQQHDDDRCSRRRRRCSGWPRATAGGARR